MKSPLNFLFFFKDLWTLCFLKIVYPSRINVCKNDVSRILIQIALNLFRGLTSSYILFSCMIKSMLTMCRYSHTIYVLCFLSAVIVYTLAAIDVLIPDWLFYIWGITVQKSVTWWFRSLNPSAVVCLILCRPARHNWLCVLFMVCFLY